MINVCVWVCVMCGFYILKVTFVLFTVVFLHNENRISDN